MKKKKKIIHITHRDYNSNYPYKGYDADDFFFAGWADQVALYVNKYTDEYAIEVWRVEKMVDKPKIRIVNNITCRLFPPTSKFVLFGEWSSVMIKALKKESNENRILIHLHNAHNLHTYFIGYVFKNLPIISANYGARPPIYSFKETKKIKFLIYYFIERITVRFFDYFFITGKDEREYYLRFVNKENISKIMGLGVDFEKIKPINKINARKILKIDLDQKIMLYVGKFFRLKGVDLIINAYKELKEKYNVKLILIGGSSKDELYNQVIESGAEVHFFLDKVKELPLYYSAADVYLALIFSDINFSKFGGIGIAQLECLACNTPLVSTSLIHFPEEDLHYVGKIPKSPEIVTKCVSEIFDNQEQYNKCRNVARKHYDWDIIAKKIIIIYKKLFEKYYSNDQKRGKNDD